MTFPSKFVKALRAATASEAGSRARMTSIAACVVAIAAAGLIWMPGSARADFEQVPEHFGVGGEAEQLRNSTAMAVNASGAGLPADEAGSFYVVGGTNRVARFSAGAEGETPRFREAWGWGIAQGGPAEAFVRCGPAYEGTANAAEETYEHCKAQPSIGYGFGGEEAGNFGGLAGVAVNPANGDVYVLNTPHNGRREHHLVEVFTATGAAIGVGFGDAARRTPPESIAEAPEKLHAQSIFEEDGIAVDEEGTVYVIDREFGNVTGQGRVMCFRPETATDYEHYEYCGQQHDITIPFPQWFNRIALVGSDRLVAAGKEFVREYSTGGGSTPICTFQVTGGQLNAMTANPVTGEVFYFVTVPSFVLHRLGSCNEATGEFEELQVPVSPAPTAKGLKALALDPDLDWAPLRPAGILYGTDEGGGLASVPNGIGYVFAPAAATPPAVLSESVSATTPTSSSLESRIDPRGHATSYRFQYLSEAAYEANEPDERQSLTVAAGGGLFGLGFRGRSLGGEFRADLSDGSATAEGLTTARGTATLKAAVGTATLHGAVGAGTVISGSSEVTAAAASEGAFGAGQVVEGDGIPSGATILSVSGSTLTLSAAATKSVANTPLHAGIAIVTSASATEGTFEEGMSIEGQGIPNATSILSVSGSELTLSKPVTKPGTGVAVTAGQRTLEGLSVNEGAFQAGMPLSGEGIPAGTTIEAVEGGSLAISNAPTKPGTGVAISSSGPAPLAAGETVEGPGIAAGTTILAAEAGQLTLSQPATSDQAEAHLRAGLPFDATAAEAQKALEGLPTIGKGDVSVSGGPGDEAGSSPYAVTFGGALGNEDLPQLSADASGLSGGPATAEVATQHDGGGGFAGAVETPAGEIGSGSPATVSAAISGLSPETAYRFRAIASSPCKGEGEPLCEAIGHPASFATYPVTPVSLPDGRAYEMVSPAQKHGGEAFPAQPHVYSCAFECKPPGSVITSVFPMQSAPSGDAVSYMGFPFSEAGAAVFNSYVSSRGASGWTTQAMSPPLLATKGGEDLSYNASLSEGVIFQNRSVQLPADPPAPAGAPDLYLQRRSDPADLRALVTSSGERDPASLTIAYAGHSADFSRHYFTANAALTGETAYAPPAPEISASQRNLYEWHAGSLRLVNVLPGNAAAAADASFASASPDAHGVSEDGSRVYWEAGGQLYVREIGKLTREVHDPGQFLAASADGLPLLLTDGCLYSLATATCADLTQGHGGFEGMLGASGDLSKIYFVDGAALAPGAEAGSCQVASSGQAKKEQEEGLVPPGYGCNLYLYEQGSGTHFIATLLATDGAGLNNDLLLNDWSAVPGLRTAEASPSGRFLAFGSTVALSGYDNVGPCGNAATGNGNEYVAVDGPCPKVFVYDSATGGLTCPSCNPSGEAPLGHSTLRRISAADENREWLPQPRYLTDSGRLFFDSQDRLSPLDSNGKVEDVYEYEPSGVGSCARAGGCVRLISPGTGTVDSNFLAMNEGGEGAKAGSDAFFTTRERLVPTDTDELIDVYDAREGGGFASATETQRPECQGEACQPAPAPPNDPTPGSSSFRGAGNVMPPKTHKCRKGKVKRHGKCVKKHARKHKHAGNRHKRDANHDRRAHR